MNRKIKLGIAPIGWSNDDLPELGAHISFEQCIKEMAEAGYEGCEVGHKFPRQPDVLHQALSFWELSVASAWFSTYFTEIDRTTETIENFSEHMRFLKAMNAKVIVVCECGHSIQGKNLPVFTAKPEFSHDQWQALIQGLHIIGEMAKAENMMLVYHHHMGTGVQYENEIDYLMQSTQPEYVSLLLDTGHLYFAGHNPLLTLKKHASRIRHVHLKDIRQKVLRKVQAQHYSFLDAVKAGVFTVPGDGCIEFEPVFQFLLDADYHGWWIVEAEQDPELANPLLFAKQARKFLQTKTGL